MEGGRPPGPLIPTKCLTGAYSGEMSPVAISHSIWAQAETAESDRKRRMEGKFVKCWVELLAL